MEWNICFNEIIPRHLLFLNSSRPIFLFVQINSPIFMLNILPGYFIFNFQIWQNFIY